MSAPTGVVEWNGKWYERRGECNGCGECCTGWPRPCPALRVVSGVETRCNIYDRRGDGDDEVVHATCGVHTTACVNFPASPGDLSYPALVNRCGYYFLECPKILLVCPTHESKEYAWDRWLERVKSLTYPNLEVLVVDNSPTPDFYERHKDAVPMLHIDCDPRPEMWLDRICRSLAVAQRHFLAGDYARWMNLEADNIPPVNVIETLLEWGHNADWVSHCYPARTGSPTRQQGIGCSLLSRRLMTDFNWATASDSPDAELWNFVRTSGAYRTVELWDLMSVEHLHG